MKRFDLVVLDMAGTTVRDGGEVPVAFEAALAAAGIFIDAARINAVRGASKRQAVIMLTPDGADREERADAIYRDFVSRLTAAYVGNVRAIDRAAATIDACRAAGLRVYLNTGFDRDITALLIRELDWAGRIDGVVSGDDVASGRPAPDLIFEAMRRAGVADARRVVNVGDTQLDLRAAAAAGVGLSVGVLSGAHTRAQLLAEPHDHLVASVVDLGDLLALDT